MFIIHLRTNVYKPGSSGSSVDAIKQGDKLNVFSRLLTYIPLCKNVTFTKVAL
jgi:hypothetical protein